ncbi:SH2 domain-containing adapter protein D [Danio aesculapii]|uniref:SH2 domain-containing adapter protein D n=1 Tax=Danio aesculapii TaxID=1142201 RepID=UPI0024BFEBBD|nr:SH2 domain-containing adapter protein D [Danio aesculapii]
MARWFKEHLGFKTSKAPPPAPPKPDYRHFQAGRVRSASRFPPLQQLQQQPDILTAYKLQKDLDFEDPYTPGGNASFTGSLGSSAGAPEVRFGSPIHRLIKVEAAERSASSPGSSSGVTAVKTPTSPPAEPDNCGGKADKLIILEDYADPFDAADQAGGTQTIAEKPQRMMGTWSPMKPRR